MNSHSRAVCRTGIEIDVGKTIVKMLTDFNNFHLFLNGRFSCPYRKTNRKWTEMKFCTFAYKMVVLNACHLTVSSFTSQLKKCNSDGHYPHLSGNGDWPEGSVDHPCNVEACKYYITKNFSTLYLFEHPFLYGFCLRNLSYRYLSS